ncbi:hypothetical protein LINGRAHAP2_LOCUS25957 [Linum grandiflorum]
MASVGLMITITAATGYAVSYHHPYEDDGITTSAQSDGFRWFLNNTNFDEDRRRPQLKYCTDLFKKLLNNGDFLNRDDFLDSVITCPDHASPPDLYTMVHCGYQSNCLRCLQDAASVIDRYCVDCYGVRVLSDDCSVRYETYSFSSFD